MKFLAGVLGILMLVLLTSQQVFAYLGRQVVKAKMMKLCDDENIFVESPEEVDIMKDLVYSGEVNPYFGPCQTPPIESLARLSELSKNVNCGREKIHEVSKFHWTYVIGSIDSKWHKAHKSTLPAALLRYFIDFATKLGEKCAHQLDDNLEKLATQLESTSSLEAAGLDHALHMLVDKSDIKKYDDFLLLWQALANKYKRKGVLTMDDVNDMKENTFSHVVLQNTAKVEWIQRECAEVLRPIYQETTLPVMNLIDLGYGQYWSLDKVSERVKEWYQVTQFCELALGVRFYRDETATLPKVIDGEQVDSDFSEVTFKYRHEAKLPTELTQITDLSDFVSSDSSISTKSKANEVRANIKSRAAVKRKMMKSLVKFACRHPLSSIKNMIARVFQNTVPEIKLAFLLDSTDGVSEDTWHDQCPIDTRSLQVGASKAPVALVKLVSQIISFIVVCFIGLFTLGSLKLVDKIFPHKGRH